MASQGQEQPGNSPEMYMKQNVQDGVENSKDFLLSSFKKKSALFITMTLDPPSLKTAWLSAAESDKDSHHNLSIWCVKFLLLSKSFNKFGKIFSLLLIPFLLESPIVPICGPLCLSCLQELYPDPQLLALISLGAVVQNSSG
ncbi:hypothetical protein MG293_008062 [Ovis ammon polii]|uniref:Uncharacterized protein n=1 Tax=Ovis ammon polii TaxID=230172 RepID=A0AAD4UCA4_OVIAM|nr:hypothetical protein MG293_008062 [Ovis ammon polii]